MILDRKFEFIPIPERKDGVMNITFYTNNTEYTDYRSLTPATARPNQAAGKTAGKYDTATFNKPQAPADDSSFARVLAREAAKRLEQGVSQEKVTGLQQQVMSGTYHPDARCIAEHMLGYR